MNGLPLGQRQKWAILHSRGSKSRMNCTICPKFKLVQDFMPILDTRKFEEVVSNTEGAMARIRSNIGLLLALNGK